MAAFWNIWRLLVLLCGRPENKALQLFILDETKASFRISASAMDKKRSNFSYVPSVEKCDLANANFFNVFIEREMVESKVIRFLIVEITRLSKVTIIWLKWCLSSEANNQHLSLIQIQKKGYHFIHFVYADTQISTFIILDWWACTAEYHLLSSRNIFQECNTLAKKWNI